MSTQTAASRPDTGLLRRTLRLVDAVATPHGVDRYLELVAPTWSTSDVRARVVAVKRGTANSVTLTLRPNRNWSGFEAGQHSLVTVEIDGVRHSRCYSIASSAHADDRRVELTVRAQPGGTVSRHLVGAAWVGQVVGLSPARGDFVLPQARPGNLVLVSGGSGITPVMSMVRTLIDEGHEGRVTVLHYDKTRADNPYHDELAQAPANVSVITVETSSPQGGRFTPAHLAEAQIDADTEIFVCGPEGLRRAVGAHLQAVGLSHRYHDEAFVPSESQASGQASGATITFLKSGRTVADDGRSLLQQARAAGLSPNHGCGVGICHTCTAPLRAGTVRQLTTGDLTQARADIGAVPIQICIHAPAGDVAVDL